jgi:UDP-N-acetylglucosamine transferase subunit ALG13
MIFVSVGTHEAPFDRLLRAVDDLRIDEPLVVQHGPSQVRCARASTEVAYLSFDEVVTYIREARAVVTHAGVGSVMISLANRKQPIVVPRRHQFGEHVDDHQLELARQLDATDLVTLVEEPQRLAEALAADAAPAGEVVGMPWLGTDLREYLLAHVGEGTTIAAAGR